MRYVPPHPLPAAIAGRPAVRAGARARAARPTSRAAQRWRPLWAIGSSVAIALVAATAVLALLDWLLFEAPVMAQRLPLEEVRTPYDKLLLADRYRDTEVVYLGDSRVRTGIHPVVVSKACECGPGFNAAFPASDPRLNRIMADRLLEKLSPGLVVIGVSQWELSDNADIQVSGPAPELVAPWRWAEFDLGLDRPSRVRDALGDAWRLYKYRAEVRVALNPWSSEAGRTERRRGSEINDAPVRLSKEHLDKPQRDFFTDFAVGGRRTEALRGLIADLHGRGIRVLLVAPPLYPDFHARVRREVAQFREAISELAAESGAALEDLTEPRRSGLTRDDFRDAVHLGEEGSDEFSRRLGKLIRDRFGPTAGRSPGLDVQAGPLASGATPEP